MMLEQFENGRKFDGKNSLQDFDAKEMYLQPRNRSVAFQKHGQKVCFYFFEHSHNAVSKMCRLECRFQNLPFSKASGKQCAAFVWEAHPSHFSPF